MSIKADIYDLIKHHCTANQISAFLQRCKEAGADQVQTSGRKDDVLEHLREAVTAGAIDLADVQAFLREAEENGNQHIYFYCPNSKDSKNLCTDFRRTTELLFGKNLATMNFHLYDRLPSRGEQYIWSDFRKLDSKDGGGWVGKIYGLEVELQLKSEDRSKEGEVVRRFQELETRTVSLVLGSAIEFG